MREHRDEFVFAPIRLLQRGFCRAAPRDLLLCTLIKACVIDGDGSLGCDRVTRRSARSVNTARSAWPKKSPPITSPVRETTGAAR